MVVTAVAITVVETVEVGAVMIHEQAEESLEVAKPLSGSGHGTGVGALRLNALPPGTVTVVVTVFVATVLVSVEAML
jgi:hypothetical protein